MNSYQWYFNDNEITNATKSFYSIPKVQSSEAGTYSVFVDNGPSWAVSSNATLSVNP